MHIADNIIAAMSQAIELPTGNSIVTFLTKTLHLVGDADALDAFISFPLLRLRRIATGGFEPDPAFTPPCLSVEAAPGMRLQLARLMEKMLAKVNMSCVSYSSCANRVSPALPPRGAQFSPCAFKAGSAA